MSEIYEENCEKSNRHLFSPTFTSVIIRRLEKTEDRMSSLILLLQVSREDFFLFNLRVFLVELSNINRELIDLVISSCKRRNKGFSLKENIVFFLFINLRYELVTFSGSADGKDGRKFRIVVSS